MSAARWHCVAIGTWTGAAAILLGGLHAAIAVACTAAALTALATWSAQPRSNKRPAGAALLAAALMFAGAAFGSAAATAQDTWAHNAAWSGQHDVKVTSRPRQTWSGQKADCVAAAFTWHACTITSQGTMELGEHLRAFGPARVRGGVLEIRALKVERTMRATGIGKALADSLARSVERQGGDESGAIVAAITLGDRNGLGNETRQTIANSGLAFLFAISGLHLGVAGTVGGGLVSLVRRGRPWGSAPVAAGALTSTVAYAMLVGGSPSLLRAAIMVAVAVGSALGGISVARGAPLPIAVSACLALWPHMALSMGFALSVAATAAIVGMHGRLSTFLPSGTVWEALALTLCAQGATVPLLWAHGLKVNVGTALTSLAATPLVAPILVLGITSAVLGLASQIAATVTLSVACWPAKALLELARWGALAPQVAPPPLPTALVCACAAALVALQWRRIKPPLQATAQRIWRAATRVIR